MSWFQRLDGRRRAAQLSLAMAAVLAVIGVAACSSHPAADGVEDVRAEMATEAANPGPQGEPAIAADINSIDEDSIDEPLIGGATTPRAPSADGDADDVSAPLAAASGGRAPAPALRPAAPPAVPVGNGMRVRIPALGVDALVVDLGLDGDELAVPGDAATVGWYTFSAAPGEAGNALLAGHVDFRGQAGAFRWLRLLSAGDIVEITIDDETFVYRVTSTRALRYDTPVTEVLETRAGAQRLTLLTCGGTFDRGRGGYDERVIVSAVRVPSPETASLVR